MLQLRQDNLAADHFSLVGCQTQLKWGEQARVFRLVPGLEQAEFVRYGLVHRNTYINGPTVLTDTWQVRRVPGFFAGQISGVEGLRGIGGIGAAGRDHRGRAGGGAAPLGAAKDDRLGALAYYVSHADAATTSRATSRSGSCRRSRQSTAGCGATAAHATRRSRRGR